MTEFKTKKDQLQKAIKRVVNIAKSKTTLPEMACLKIETKVDHIEISGTNGNMNIKTKCNAEIKSEGSFLFNAKKLEHATNRAKSDITITNESNTNTFKSGKFKLISQCLDIDCFPVFDDVDTVSELLIKSSTIKNGLSKVSYATSIDNARKILQGINIKIKDGEINIAGTDGKRLSLYHDKLDNKEINVDVTINKDLMTFTQSLENDLTISFSDKKIILDDTFTTISSNLIDGSFPNYTVIIPPEQDQGISINKVDFVSCIDNAMVVQSMFTQAKIGNNKICLESKNTQETSIDEMDINSDKNIKFNCNPIFVREIFTNCDNDEVKMSAIDGYSPIRIDEPNYTCVFMPMRDQK